MYIVSQTGILYFFQQFLRTTHVGDLEIYLKSLVNVMPWVFTLDRTNYKKSLPTFLADMCYVKHNNPELYKQLGEEKHFVGQKSNRRFSRVAMDECTENLVCWLKQESAVIGNLDNPETVRREQVAWPEFARMCSEYEESTSSKAPSNSTKHHEETKKAQVDFMVTSYMLYLYFVDFMVILCIYHFTSNLSFSPNCNTPNYNIIWKLFNISESSESSGCYTRRLG